MLRREAHEPTVTDPWIAVGYAAAALLFIGLPLIYLVGMYVTWRRRR